MKFFRITFLAFILLPSVVFAADTFASLIGKAVYVINLAIPVLGGAILLVFMWNSARYIFSAGNAEEKGKGKALIGWGIAGLFVVFSIWGIVNIIANTFIK